MTKRSAITQAVLWLFVLNASILNGGGLFEHTVLTPLWAGRAARVCDPVAVWRQPA